MTIAPAFAPEFSTERGSVGGDVIVATASADLTESIAFYSPAGDEIGDRFNPTTTLAYNMPPLLSHAVLSPDGSELAWLEGPDHNGVTQTVEGDWVLVVADSRSGRERLRQTIAEKDSSLLHLDFDGRWAVVSEGTESGEAHPPLVLDTRAGRPVAHVLRAVKGIATLADAPLPKG